MSLQKLIHNYATYNAWANSKFVDWLQTINEELLYKEIPSSFTSLDYTIQHMKVNELVNLAKFTS